MSADRQIKGRGGYDGTGLFGGWSDLAAASDDQGRRHDRMARGTGVALESREQSLDGEPADLVWMLRHDGDTGIDQICERKIVEADERDRSLALLCTQGMERADRDQILGAEDRCGRLIGAAGGG